MRRDNTIACVSSRAYQSRYSRLQLKVGGTMTLSVGFNVFDRLETSSLRDQGWGNPVQVPVYGVMAASIAAVTLASGILLIGAI